MHMVKLIELRFFVPLDTKFAISEKFFTAKLLAWYRRNWNWHNKSIIWWGSVALSIRFSFVAPSSDSFWKDLTDCYSLFTSCQNLLLRSRRHASITSCKTTVPHTWIQSLDEAWQARQSRFGMSTTSKMRWKQSV